MPSADTFKNRKCIFRDRNIKGMCILKNLKKKTFIRLKTKFIAFVYAPYCALK